MGQFKKRHYRGVSEALLEAYLTSMSPEEGSAIVMTGIVLGLMFKEDSASFSIIDFDKACTTGEYSYAPPSG